MRKQDCHLKQFSALAARASCDVDADEAFKKLFIVLVFNDRDARFYFQTLARGLDIFCLLTGT